MVDAYRYQLGTPENARQMATIMDQSSRDLIKQGRDLVNAAQLRIGAEACRRLAVKLESEGSFY